MSGTLRVDHLVPVYEDVHFSAHASILRMAQGGALERATWEKILERNGSDQFDRVVVRHHCGRGQPVSLIRNEMARQALKAAAERPERTEEDHVLLWQDSDVAVEVDHAAELLARLALAREDVGAIAAVVPIQDEREGPLRPNVSLEHPPTYHPSKVPDFVPRPAELQAALMRPEPGRRPIQVYRVGLAFVAVRAAAYLQTFRPWHDFVHIPPDPARGDGALGEPDEVLGEDLGWCDAVRAAGFSIWVAPDLRADHVVRRRLSWPRWGNPPANTPNSPTEDAR